MTNEPVNMPCRHEAHKLLHAYHDGELDLARALGVERHLESCADCAAELGRLRALRDALHRELTPSAMPEALRNRILSQTSGSVARVASVPTPATVPATVPPRVWPLRALAIAAGLLAIAAWIPVLMHPKLSSPGDPLESEIIANHVRSMMVDHLTDVASSDQHTVKPWFNGKLDFSPRVEDFAAQGFPLIGGRLDYLAGRAVVALAYRRNQHIINLFTWPENSNSMPTAAAPSPGDLPSQLSRDGYHLLHWTADGMIYWMISDLNPAEMNALAALIRNPTAG